MNRSARVVREAREMAGHSESRSQREGTVREGSVRQKTHIIILWRRISRYIDATRR